MTCKETLANSKRDFNIAKSEDEQKIVLVEEKLRKANENITQVSREGSVNNGLDGKVSGLFPTFSSLQQLQAHDQDGALVASLREENAKLLGQLSALQESLQHPIPTTAAASATSASTTDCNQHCLVLVEAAQQRLFKKIAAKYGQDALLVLQSADFGIPRRPGKMVTGDPPPGKLADNILVVGRDGQIESGSLGWGHL